MTIKITVEDKPINATYDNVSGTIGAGGVGTDAKFDVVKTDGVYAVTLDSANQGTGYVAGDTITIAGTNLGGTAPANNLIVTVGTVGLGGKIATFGTVGTGRAGDGNIDILVDVTGTKGIDTYKFTGDSDDYTVAFSKGDIVATSDLATNLTFTLHDHERVEFDDKHLAFDFTKDTDLGKIYALMAAAVGESDVKAEHIGIGMYLHEDKNLSLKEIASDILHSKVYLDDAGGATNAIFAKHVWKNVFGADGTYDQINFVVELIEKHGVTKEDVLMYAATRPELLTQIDYVGIQTVGLEFVPYAG